MAAVNLHVLMPYLHRCAIIFAINCLLCLALRCTLLACIAVLVSFHGVHVYVYLYLKESIVFRRHPVDATRSLFAFRLM